jgi:hypothetical protein
MLVFKTTILTFYVFRSQKYAVIRIVSLRYSAVGNTLISTANSAKTYICMNHIAGYVMNSIH